MSEYIYYIESGNNKKIGKSKNILNRIKAYQTCYGKNTNIELYEVKYCDESEKKIKNFISLNNLIDKSNSEELLNPNISIKDLKKIKKIMIDESISEPIICNLWECESKIENKNFKVKKHQLDALYKLLEYRKEKYVYLSNCQGSGKTYIEYLWCNNMMLTLQNKKAYIIVRKGTLKIISNILKNCCIKDYKIKTDNGTIFIVDENIKNLKNEIIVLDDFNEMNPKFINSLLSHNKILFVSALCSPPISCPEINTCISIQRPIIEHDINLQYNCNICNSIYKNNFISYFKKFIDPYCIKCKTPTLNIIFQDIKPFTSICIDTKSDIYNIIYSQIINQNFKIKLLNGNLTTYPSNTVLIIDCNKKNIDGIDITRFCNYLYIIHQHLEPKKLLGRFLRIGNEHPLHIYK
jgi:hypothetical protein